MAHLRLNFSRTEIVIAKAMAVGCVQYYSTYSIKKLGKSLEPFFHKVQKTANKCKKWPKMPILAKSAMFRKKAAL